MGSSIVGALVAVVVVFFGSIAHADPTGSRGCGMDAPETPGVTATRTLDVGGITRSYNVHLPIGYDDAVPAALVLNFHGYAGTSAGHEAATGMSLHADEHGYIVVYPQASYFAAGQKPGYLFGQVASWNDLSCSGSPGPDGPTCSDSAFEYPVEQSCAADPDKDACNWCHCSVDDIAFVSAMLDDLESNLCVDTKSVFATGFSNGAMLTHRLGCAIPSRFAAIAPVSGTLMIGYNCAPPSGLKLSLMQIHGVHDRTIPIDGRSSSDGYFYTAVDEVVDRWAADDSQDCESEDTPYPTSADGVRMLSCSERADCSSGAEVVHCSWNERHTWPATQNGTPFGNDIIWEFFEANSR